jgi:hypothetical protein
MNIFDASRRQVQTYPGGIEACATRLNNKSASTLEKELRMANGYKWGALDALELSVMSQQVGAPDALAYPEAVAAAVHCMLVPLPSMPDVPFSDAMLTVASTSAAVHKLITEACEDLADGAVNDNELRRVDKVIGDVMAQMRQMRRAFVALNKAGKARGRA